MTLASARPLYPLTHAQKRIWINDEMHENSSVSNIGAVALFEETLDFDLLASALNHVIERHSAFQLRMASVRGDEGIVTRQYLEPFHTRTFLSIDYSNRADDADLLGWARERLSVPFQRFENDLFEYVLVRASGGRSGFFYKSHHVISDGWTAFMLFAEIEAAYRSLSNGEAPGREPAPSYLDYLGQEASFLASEACAQERRYWLNKFSALPEPASLAPPGKGPAASLQAASLTLAIPAELRESLHAFSAREGRTRYEIILAALALCINRYSGQSDICIGSVSHNRATREQRQMAGMFVSTIPLRLPVDTDCGFRALVAAANREIRSTLRGGRRYPYDLLAGELKKANGLSRINLGDVSLIDHPDCTGQYRVQYLFSGEEVEPLGIHLNASDRDRTGILELTYNYQTDLFSPEDIRTLHQSLTTVLANALASPDEPVSRLEMIGAAEKREILAGFNDTAAPFPERDSLVSLFEARVGQCPDQTGLVFHDTRLTYGELNRAANRLAHRLCREGLGPDRAAAILMDRSELFMITALAVLKAGGAYLPLDPAYPAARLREILEDSGAVLLLHDGTVPEGVSCSAAALDLRGLSLQSEPEENPGRPVDPHHLAYIIYTSGSTGKPKGVLIEHRSVVNYLTWHARHYHLDGTHRCAAHASFSFDASVPQLFSPLLSGAELHILDREIRLSAVDVNDYFERHGITHADLPTQFAEQFMNAVENTSLRSLTTGGEKLQRFRPRHFRLVDEYGPTEYTVSATSMEVAAPAARIPIGRPIANTRIVILDRHGNLQPVGVPGELCISGAGLARGYLNRPELTAERFAANPQYPGERMYRTGDMARWLPDGKVDFIGRQDFQVKIRGFRIELGDVESVLRQHPEVEDAAVIHGATTAGAAFISAHAVLRNNRVPCGDSALRFVTVAQDPTLVRRMEALHETAWPAFFAGDTVNARHWRKLYQAFPKLQFALLEGNLPIAAGNMAPLRWDGVDEHIPSGWDDALERSFQDQEQGLIPNTVCVLAGVVGKDARGRNLSLELIRSMAWLTSTLGFAHLILPVRPTLKTRYPHMSLREYAAMTREEDGLPFDPWLRLHVRLGGRQIGYSEVSQTIEGTVTQWEEWSGRGFDRSGDYEVEGAMQPVHIDLDQNRGTYSDQAVWYEHDLNKYRDHSFSTAGRQDILAFLAANLPDYMVPARFSVVEKIPVTTAGKVDRNALLATVPQEHSPSERVGPRTDVEKTLAGIWKEVLQLESVGINDDFFQLGGDSIMSIQILSRARTKGLRIKGSKFFANPTIAGMAAVAEHSVPTVEDRPAEGDATLIPIQSWFFDLGLAAPHHFNQAFCLKPRNVLDPAMARQALEAIGRRHDALRLRYRIAPDGTVRQSYAPPETAVFTFEHVDLRVCAEQERTARLDDLRRRLQSGFDLVSGPLAAAALVDGWADGGQRLLLSAHHLVIDFVSWRILLEDFESTCQSLEQGARPVFPPRTASYAEWGETLRRYGQSHDLLDTRDYWESVVDAALRLKCDREGPLPILRDTEVRILNLPPSVTEALLERSNRLFRTNANDVLLTALALAVFRWSGSRDLYIDMEGHGREESVGSTDVSRTVGWFTSLYPVRLRLPADLETVPEPTRLIRALLAIKETLRAIPSNGVGFGVLRHLSSNPLAAPLPDLSFNYLGSMAGGDAAFLAFTEESAGELVSAENTAPHRMEIDGFESRGSLAFQLRYSSNHFDPESMDAFLAAFRSSLEDLAEVVRDTAVGAFSPSDFPHTGLDQAGIDRLTAGASVEDIYRLTPLQEGILFQTCLHPESGEYVNQTYWRFLQPVDNAALRQAWIGMTRNHPVFRTSFVWEDLPHPLQIVHEPLDPEWAELDWRSLPEDEFAPSLDSLLREDRKRGFDLRKPGLIRALLIHCRHSDYFLMTDHHILTDGWCVPLLLDELDERYAAHREKRSAEVAGTPPFSRMIDWLYRQDRREAESFWKKQLGDMAAPLPLGIEKPGISLNDRSAAGQMREMSRSLSPSISERSAAFSRENGCTLAALLQAAWAVSLSVASGVRDCSFGLVVSGRPEELPGVEKIIGLFIGTAPLRIRLDEGVPARAAIREIAAVGREVNRLSYIGLEAIRVQSGIRPPDPLFHSLFALENYPTSEYGARPNGMRLGQIESIERAELPLALIVFPGSTITLKASYDERLVEPGGVAFLLDLLPKAIQGILDAPERPLAELAGALAQASLKSVPPAPSVTTRELSPAQEMIWVRSRVPEAEMAFHVSFILTFQGRISLPRLNEALDLLVVRHDSLRTSFVESEGGLRMMVQPSVRLKKQFRSVPDTDPYEVLREWQKPFDLSRAPLLRVLLVKSAADRHHLLFDAHRLVFDPASIEILAAELAALYRGEELPPPEVQFGDYAAWQRQLLSIAGFRTGEAFWKEHLKGGAVALRLIPDRPRTAGAGYDAASIDVPLDAAAAAALNRSPSARTFFLAAIQLLLADFAEENEVTVGVSASNRTLPELSRMPGAFETIMPVRTAVDRSVTISQWMERTRLLLNECVLRSNYPVDTLYRTMDLSRESGRDPLFDVSVRFHEPSGSPVEMAPDVRMTIMPAPPRSVLQDLEFHIDEQHGGWRCSIAYRKALYDTATVERLGRRLARILSAFAGRADAPLSAIAMIPDEEQDLLLHGFNATEHENHIERTIHSLFEECARRHPDQPAILFEDRRMTYGELNRRADRVADLLAAKGIGTEDLVGIFVEPSMEMLVAILGVLKAGAGFVPLDAGYPAARITHILGDCGARMFLTQPHLADRVPFPGDTVALDCSQPEDVAASNASDGGSVCPATPRNVAYAIYTSGSTGKPKGTLIEHRSLVNLTAYFIRKRKLGPGEVIAKYMSVGFDASMLEIFPALCSGAAICMIPAGYRLSIDELAAHMTRHEVTGAIFPTTFGEHFLGMAGVPSLRWVQLGGDRLRKPPRGPRVLNGYGPTEYTVLTTEFPVDGVTDNIPIGRPIDNTRVYILDRDLRLLPIGVPGELCVAGAGLSRGYLNRPDLTAQKFVAVPFRSGELVYRTGDLARFLPSGDLEFLGRIDLQVKIRGYRIETGEIEQCLLSIPGVTGAAVIAAPDPSGEKELRAYFTAGEQLTAGMLRDRLSESLPPYMVPAHFTQLEQIPLTAHGKLDARALPAPELPVDAGQQDKALSAREAAVAAVWCEVLGLPGVGRHDNFFSLGGHSLKAIAVSAKLQKSFDVSVADLFKYQTVAELAQHLGDEGDSLKKTLQAARELLANPQNGLPGNAEAVIAAEREAYLERSRRFDAIDLSGRKEYRSILLTGATGHVGAYLLAELAAGTEAELHVLVRGQNAAAAKQRLEERLCWYFGPEFLQRVDSRLRIHCGDVASPRLGLDESTYARLCTSVDAIVNAAADVRHYGRMEEFQSANVTGIDNLLALTQAGNPKDLHHISSMSVSLGAVPGRPVLLYTEDDTDVGQRLDNPYLQTKLEAERRLLAARAKGIKASIYRIGNCTVGSNTGRFQLNVEENAFFQRMKSLLVLGTALRQGDEEDFSCTDHICRAIVALLRCPALAGETWHVANPTVYPMAAVLGNAATGLRVDVVPPLDFVQALEERAGSPVFLPSVENFTLHSGWNELRGQQMSRAIAGVERTQRVLCRLGFAWPRLEPVRFRPMALHALRERAEALALCPAFARLTPEQRSELAALARPRWIRNGQDAVCEGLPADGIHMVQCGLVEVSRRSLSGWQGTLGVLGPGSLFGMEQLTRPGVSGITAEAVMGDAVCLSFLPEDLRAFCHSYPDAALNLLGDLADRLSNTERMVVAMS